MANESVSNSALAMDRGLPLGNTPPPSDPEGRRRLHTKIANELTEPVPVVVVDGVPGEPYFVEFDGPTTPGVEQTLIDFNTAATILDLYQARVVCRFEGSWRLEMGGALIASGRTGAAVPSSPFPFLPPRPVSPGVNIKLTFISRAGSPIADLEAYLGASYRGA